MPFASEKYLQTAIGRLHFACSIFVNDLFWRKTVQKILSAAGTLLASPKSL
jgi:hypothetical protein